jgi:hypothetical protein
MENHVSDLYETAGKIIVLYTLIAMLSGSLVTTAWRVLGLRMEEKASRYEGQLRIY